jgi:parallel beta helix pectate lyase-like protein
MSHLLRRATVVGAVVSSVLVVAPAAQARGLHCGSHVKHSITLRRNLHNCRGDGLVVARSNIVINLHGHTIDGRGRRGTAGVRIHNFHGVTVKFGVIRQFGRGIWVVHAGDNKIQSNVVSGSFDEGIFVNETSPRVLIQGNRISWSGTRSHAAWADGVDARGAGVTVVANSVRHSNDDGIDVNGAGATIDGNNVAGSVHDGFDIDSATALVQNNTSTSNHDDGIGVGRNASNVTIRSNVANSNTDLGIQPIAGTAIDGGGNRASGNGDPRQCVRISCAP